MATTPCCMQYNGQLLMSSDGKLLLQNYNTGANKSWFTYGTPNLVYMLSATPLNWTTNYGNLTKNKARFGMKYVSSTAADYKKMDWWYENTGYVLDNFVHPALTGTYYNGQLYSSSSWYQTVDIKFYLNTTLNQFEWTGYYGLSCKHSYHSASWEYVYGPMIDANISRKCDTTTWTASGVYPIVSYINNITTGPGGTTLTSGDVILSPS